MFVRLKNKLPDFHNMIYTKLPDLVFISESWFNNSITSCHIDPMSYYNIFRFDRCSKTGGGLCALVKKSIRSTEVPINADQIILTSTELLCFDTLHDGYKLRFFLMYRPPYLNCSSDHDITLRNEMLVNLITDNFDPYNSNFLLGDFNLPNIDWILNLPKRDGIHDLFFDCFSNLGLYQFVMEPTHCSHSGKDNILDLILSNDPLGVIINQYSDPLSTSDHITIDFSIVLPYCDVDACNTGNTHVPTDIPAPSKIYDWASADYASINAFLSQVDWSHLFSFYFTPDDLWNQFKSIIWPIIDMFVPVKIIHHTNKIKYKTLPQTHKPTT